MNVTSILLQEAVADLTKALSYETTRYLKTSGEKIEQSKLHHAENWKPIFNNVAQRYVEDLVKRNLDPKKRINVDLTALNKTVPSKDKYQNLLKDRSEIQDYLRKQIVLITDEGAKRVLKNRDPHGYEQKEQEIKSTTPTPDLTKAELKAKEADVGLVKKVSKTISKKIENKSGKGSARAISGKKFEDKIQKEFEKEGGKADIVHSSVTIPLIGDGAKIANRIYSALKKNPNGIVNGTVSETTLRDILDHATLDLKKASKADLKYDGVLYELKKDNIYEPTIFCEIWKIATESDLANLRSLLGSDGKTSFLYNNFIKRAALDIRFTNTLDQGIRRAMHQTNTHIVAVCGPKIATSKIGIFRPPQLIFKTIASAPEYGNLNRLTVIVTTKEQPIKVLGTYADLKESVFADIIIGDLLKENVRIQHRV